MISTELFGSFEKTFYLCKRQKGGLRMERRIVALCILLLTVLMVGAQTVVSGVVTDRQTGRPLPHVSVTVESSSSSDAHGNTQVHTVTNEEGRFTLKVLRAPRYIHVSHIGYKSRCMMVNANTMESIHIALTASSVNLQEVLVSTDNALLILRAAMRRLGSNYPQEPELMRCFYRETARRGSRYVSVAEAVMNMYKSDYSYGPEYDAVAILKGRRLMSMKAKDTLGVKIQGGPVMALMVDIAKCPDYLLNEDNLSRYDLRMEMPVKIADRLQYVIRLSPRGPVTFPQMTGLLYVDQEMLAFTRAELELDMRDWRKASELMLVKKPLGLHFRPKELSVIITYETDTKGMTRMSYVRNVMRFNCDWKRRLFASTYTTVSEMVVTDRLEQGSEVKRPLGRSSFGIRERFYDKVAYFEDPDFWLAYNIIEPSEPLEHAIGKLKKNVQSH